MIPDEQKNETDAPETPEAPETDGAKASETPETDAPEGGQEATTGTEAPASEAEPEGDTFSREYVQELRGESAGYRTQLRAVQERLHGELVRATGLLADPADLEFDAAHLEDPEALTAAIEALVAAKPHLKARRFAPDAAAQGTQGKASAGVDLLGMLRANA